MRQAIISIFVASTLLLGCQATNVQNFDDHEKAQQRSRDLADNSPLTSDEVRFFRKMLEKGRFKIVRDEPNELPEVDSEGRKIRRVLKSKASDKTSKKATVEVKTTSKTSRSHSRGRSRPSGTMETVSTGSRNSPTQYTQSSASESTTRHHYYDDDDDGDDDWYPDDDTTTDDSVSGSGVAVYEWMLMEGFQDARNLQDAIVPDVTLPDEYDIGAMYLWNSEPLYGTTYDFSGNTSSTDGRIVDESDEFATVSGKCTRIDPHDELDSNYVGMAYCQFIYDFYDAFGIIQLNAEGPVKIGETGVLAVTGGTSVFRRTVGEIRLTPVDPSFLSSTPPGIQMSFVQDLPTSYFLEAYIYVDTTQLDIVRN